MKRNQKQVPAMKFSNNSVMQEVHVYSAAHSQSGQIQPEVLRLDDKVSFLGLEMELEQEECKDYLEVCSSKNRGVTGK